jgi:hypothetical protein
MSAAIIISLQRSIPLPPSRMIDSRSADSCFSPAYTKRPSYYHQMCLNKFSLPHSFSSISRMAWKGRRKSLYHGASHDRVGKICEACDTHGEICKSFSQKPQLEENTSKNQTWREDNIAIVDHSGRAVWGINCLRFLAHWGRGFETHSSHGCLSTFILCLCCPL